MSLSVDPDGGPVPIGIELDIRWSQALQAPSLQEISTEIDRHPFATISRSFDGQQLAVANFNTKHSRLSWRSADEEGNAPSEQLAVVHWVAEAERWERIGEPDADVST